MYFKGSFKLIGAVVHTLYQSERDEELDGLGDNTFVIYFKARVIGKPLSSS